MRISDWSSDGCSSDLMLRATEYPITRKFTDVVPVALPKIKLKDENDWSTVIAAMESVAQEQGGTAWMVGHGAPYRMAAKTGSAQVAGLRQDESRPVAQEIGRASCRERVCQYV